MTHMCVVKLTIFGSDNGLSPGRRQAIIWTNAGILLIGPLGTNFIEILIEIHTFSFKKMHLKMSSAKWRLFCLGPNVLSLLNECWIQNTLTFSIPLPCKSLWLVFVVLNLEYSGSIKYQVLSTIVVLSKYQKYQIMCDILHSNGACSSSSYK